MNVMFVSQCDKRALTETRRVLDQFAERRGDRTWQTPSPKTVCKPCTACCAKRRARTPSLACHWIRGAGQTELLWVVGDRNHFNAQGAVPTNTTKRNILRQQDENTWHHGQLIGALADLSGLLHDLGKAMNAFQDRLRGKLVGKNLVRHEWASVRLFEAFVGCDDDATWLARLAIPTALDDALWIDNLNRDSPNSTSTSPFKTLAGAPLAQALAWLVVTHHRLPQLPWTHPLEQKAQAPIFRMSELPGQLMRMGPAWNEDNFEKATPPHVGTVLAL